MSDHRPADDLVHAGERAVTVWSDISCPWASVTLHTLRGAIAAAGADLVVEHRAFPLELVNGGPTAYRYIEPEKAALAAALPELGWRPWPGPGWDYPVSTLPALEAVRAARHTAIDGARAADQLDAALRQAFFADGRCITVLPVLTAVLADCPLVDADRVLAALAAGTYRSELHRDHRLAAASDRVRGSSQVFGGGLELYNPGVAFHKNGRGGYPVIDAVDPAWATDLVARVLATPLPPA